MGKKVIQDMITIIDYGVGNINAFVNAYKRMDIPVKIAKKEIDLKEATKLVLPGVGHFDSAMGKLNDSGMRAKLDDLVLHHKIPVIGICVGMQIMANYSDEGNKEGLKWFDASVKKFDESKIPHATKLPHMGWNDVKPKNGMKLFRDLEEEAIFYFLHSYYFECNQPEDVMAVSQYGIEFASAIHRENKYGIQFHPEKSHNNGEILLRNFAKLQRC